MRSRAIRRWTEIFVLSCCVSSSTAAAPQLQLQQSPLITEKIILRHLQNENGDSSAYSDPDAYSYPYDLSTFSIRFDKCQNVKYYSDDLAADEDATTPLAIKPLVAFRICPSDECETCQQNYGKYVVDLESYLAYTVENQRESFEEMCNNCAEQCDDAGESCTGCGKLCYQYENLEAAGLVDASNYIECQELEIDNNNERKRKRRTRRHRQRRRKLEDEGGEEGEEDRDDEDENQEDHEDEDQQDEDEEVDEDEEEEGEDEEDPVYYIGPKCSSSGQKIEIGLFYDEYCSQAFSQADQSAMNLTELLGGTMSYHLMSHSFTNDGSICLSCQEPADENEKDENDQQDADDVNEMCEELYDAAAKCETPTGITAGFIQTNRDEGEYENQVETEFMACTFINSIYWNSYTATGEIEYRKAMDVYERYVTNRQTIVLASLCVFTACCIIATFWLENKIKQVTVVNKLTGKTTKGGVIS